jgi:hypothetical protein
MSVRHGPDARVQVQEISAGRRPADAAHVTDRLVPEAWYVTRTMRALELLAFQPLSAPQLAASLETHPRTARRLLTRLHEEGYLALSGDARRLYTPTLRVVALAAQIVERSPLARRAMPYVARLHEQTGAAVHLAGQMGPGWAKPGRGPARPRRQRPESSNAVCIARACAPVDQRR